MRLKTVNAGHFVRFASHFLIEGRVHHLRRTAFDLFGLAARGCGDAMQFA